MKLSLPSPPWVNPCPHSRERFQRHSGRSPQRSSAQLVCVHHDSFDAFTFNAHDARGHSRGAGAPERSRNRTPFTLRRIRRFDRRFSCLQSRERVRMKVTHAQTFMLHSRFAHYNSIVAGVLVSAPIPYSEALRLDAELVRAGAWGVGVAARHWRGARRTGVVRRALRARFFVARSVRAGALRAHGALGGGHAGACSQA